MGGLTGGGLGTPTANATVAGGRPIEPIELAGGVLEFSLERIRPGARLSIIYATAVGLDAKPGTFDSEVTTSFESPLGPRESSVPVKLAVTVTPSSFASAQVILGRVFDDANGNGRFDADERGLSKVRLFLPTGQAVTTDGNGQYNLPAVIAGTTSITIDRDTVPAGYGLPANAALSEGWSRLLRTPFGAGTVLRQNFALTRGGSRTAEAAPAPAADNGSSSPVTPPADASRMWERVIIDRLSIEVGRPEIAAGGRDRTAVLVRAFDRAGAPVPGGVVTMETTAGQWLVPSPTPNTESGRLGLAIDPVQARLNQPVPSTDLSFCRPEAEGSELPAQLFTGVAPLIDGVARLCLESSTAPATAYVRAIATDGGQVEATASVRFTASRQRPVVAAVGEVTFGPGEPATADTPGTDATQANGAVFVQTAITRNSQATIAWTSAPTINESLGRSRLHDLDPTDRAYAVFGDSSTRQEFAVANAKMYARVDFGRSSVLYGDLPNDRVRQGRSGLLDVNRGLTGAQLHLQANERGWLALQAARPSTAFAREVFIGATAVGSVVLGKTPILRGSEVLTLEVRDRRRPDLVTERIPLVRSVDYSIDPIGGFVYFNRPMPVFADSLALVDVVATYEYLTSGLQTDVYVVRGAQQFDQLGLELRGMFSRQAATDGRTGAVTVGGLEGEQRLPMGGWLRFEAPFSRASDGQVGHAWRVDVEQPLAARKAVLQAQFVQTDEAFANPFGAPAVQGSTIGSAGVVFMPSTRTRARLGLLRESASGGQADATRDSVTAEWTQQLSRRLSVGAAFDARQLTDRAAGRAIDSQLLSATAEWRPTDRLQASVRREQNLGAADPTYPNQTLLNGRYQLTADTQVVATQRWSDAPIVPMTGGSAAGLLLPSSTQETSIGLESRFRRFTTLSSKYQLGQSINGADAMAVLGVLTRIPVYGPLSVDFGLDRASSLLRPAAASTNVSGGFAFAPDDWRATLHFQMRTGLQDQRLFTTGLAGELTPGLTVLGHYRHIRYAEALALRDRTDAVASMAIRPRQTDRGGLLFSWNYGEGMSQVQVIQPDANQRLNRLSADGYLQVTSKLELYSRAAWLRTGVPGQASTATTLLAQQRGQWRVGRRVDLAGEVRWANELSASGSARWIGAGEVGFWVIPDLRLGVGYTTQPWSEAGQSLPIRPGNGGWYFALSSPFSRMFDLLGRAATTPAAP